MSAEPVRDDADGPQQAGELEPEWFALPEGEPMGIEDIRDALVIREGAIFLLTDSDGNAPAGNRQGHGIYHGDTRHLSAYDVSLNGARPVMLLSTAHSGYAMEQVMTNPRLSHVDGRTIERGSIEIRRRRVVEGLVQERMQLTNFNPYPVTINLLYDFGADFADIFDIRGYERERFGSTLAAEIGERSIHYRYTGIDAKPRDTRIEFDRKPDYLDPATALFRITLPARDAASLEILIGINGGGTPQPPPTDPLETVATRVRTWLRECTSVTTGHAAVNRAIIQSLRDVRMLWSKTDAGEPYPAAGTPWFDAFFGRDSCIVSMQMMAYRPQIARDCLRLLAKYQGTKVDPARDEEPGKILHELRFDELSRCGELPYGPYYGSIDSTPLFLMLAAEYHEWTADDALIRELLPSIRAALRWMDTYGDPRGSGYLAYEKRSAKGLVNQGWKDSWDAVMHADGTLAPAPIALAEVQGYAYAARLGIARLFERIGETEAVDQLRRDAETLRARFNRDFWLDDLSYYALAVDGRGVPARSIASNAAHCLWTDIIDEVRAPDVVRTIMSERMFSGWGIRTLASGTPRFNPIGYHLGTVWPHDNSIAAMGLKTYGFATELNELASAMFDAAYAFPYLRLPELFGGQSRVRYSPPVPYPVACRPQSWAAGTLPFILQAMLGLRPCAPESRLRVVAPQLPEWLGDVVVHGLRVGPGVVDLRFRPGADRTEVEVIDATGGINVTIEDRWPSEDLALRR
jgi:glycogen debranching enzyme